MAHSKLATLNLGSLLCYQDMLSVPPFAFDLLASIKNKYAHDGSPSQSSRVIAQQLSWNLTSASH